MEKFKDIKVEKIEQEIVEASCDFCGCKFKGHILTSHGYGLIRISFGYGSSFDDNHFYLEICDKCFIKNFGFKLRQQFREKGFDMKKLLLDYPDLQKELKSKMEENK